VADFTDERFERRVVEIADAVRKHQVRFEFRKRSAGEVLECDEFPGRALAVPSARFAGTKAAARLIWLVSPSDSFRGNETGRTAAFLSVLTPTP
jgi:hypothetical protein